ncbi:MAG: hypothetical protein MPJ50_00050 [Pirellulales bacterium]|nr:hypothetical protein [Pirellulales bacterium]
MPLSRKTRICLALLFVAAFGVRAAAVLVLESYHDPYTYEHGEIAENLLAGKGFRVTFLGVDGLTSQQAPLYPCVLAGSYWCLGSKTDAAHLALQLLQCVVGAAVIPCVFLLTRSFTTRQPAVAWVAAAGAAVYPPHVYMVTHIQVAVWATFALAWLAAWSFSHRYGGWPKAVGLGVLSGALLLIDPILALALPFLAIAYWLRLRSTPLDTIAQLTSGAFSRLPWLSPVPYAKTCAMAAVAALVVTPWVIRNYRVHGEFVFVKSTFGYAFWQGNNSRSWGTDKIPKRFDEALQGETLADVNRWLADARSETLYIDDELLTAEDDAALRALNEPARSRLLGARAKSFIREHPGDYAALCWQRLRYFFWIDATNPKASHPIYVSSTSVWLASFLLGLAVLHPQDRVAWLSLVIVLAVGLFHVMTISSARFRLPIEPMSFPWCAAAAVWIAKHGISSFRSWLTFRSQTPSRMANPPIAPNSA